MIQDRTLSHVLPGSFVTGQREGERDREGDTEQALSDPDLLSSPPFASRHLP